LGLVGRKKGKRETSNKFTERESPKQNPASRKKRSLRSLQKRDSLGGAVLEINVRVFLFCKGKGGVDGGKTWEGKGEMAVPRKGERKAVGVWQEKKKRGRGKGAKPDLKGKGKGSFATECNKEGGEGH